MILDGLIAAGLKILDKVIPDPTAKSEAQYKLLQLAQTGELAELDAEFKLALGQLEVNKVEATSSDPFVAGWRPAVGWVCVGGFAYVVLIQPLLPWVVNAAGAQVPPLPNIDTSVLLTLLIGMLGLGGLRTTEKIKGVATK